MKKIYFLTFFVFLFLLKTAYASQEIKKYFKNTPEEYFLVVINSQNNICCSGNLVPDVNKILSKYGEKYVYYILNTDAGISSKTANNFLYDYLNVKIPYNHIICNNQIYNQVINQVPNNPSESSVILLVKQNKIIESCISKFESISNKNKMYIKQNINLSFVNKYNFSQMDIGNSLNNSIYSISNNKLIMFSTSQQKFYSIDLNTLKVEVDFSLEKNGLDNLSLYLRTEKKTDSVIINNIKKSHQIFLNNKKPDIRIFNTVDLDSNQITILSKSTYLIDSVLIHNYHFVSVDTLFNLKKIYALGNLLNEPIISDSLKFWPSHCFFNFNGKIYLQNEITEKLYDLDTNRYKATIYSKFSEFKLADNKLNFQKFLVPIIRYNIGDVSYNYARFNNNVYLFERYSNRIFNINNTKEYTLEGYSKPLIPEVYPQKYKDYETKIVSNFDIRISKKILNGNFLAILYRYQQKDYILEIKDKDINTVATINISEKINKKNKSINSLNALNARNNLCISNDYLFWYTFENNQFVLYKYQIQLN